MAFSIASSASVVAARPARVAAVRRAAPAVPRGLGASARLGSTRGLSLAGAKPASGRALSMRVRAEGETSVTERVSTDTVMIDPVVGAKRFSNYFWAGVVTTGATGFLITGASAYFEHNLLWFLDASEIKFFPQGLVMSFYGVAGSLLATYLWLTINWEVGAGYNEFNKDEGIMRIFRYGFPGKNRRINLVTPLQDIQAVRVEIADGVNPRRVVYVRCKNKSDIPLTRIGQPLTLAEVEKQAADLAKFLQVPIEGL